MSQVLPNLKENVQKANERLADDIMHPEGCNFDVDPKASPGVLFRAGERLWVGDQETVDLTVGRMNRVLGAIAIEELSHFKRSVGHSSMARDLLCVQVQMCVRRWKSRMGEGGQNLTERDLADIDALQERVHNFEAEEAR
mgnify:CR=1 FL=1